MKPLQYHLATDVEQQYEGYPRYEWLELLEYADYCMDAEPACHRHDELEDAVGEGHPCHSCPAHLRVHQTVGNGYRKGIHGQPHTQENTVYEKYKVPVHNKKCPR